MPKLSLYIEENFLFTMHFAPDLTLRQLIVVITSTVRQLKKMNSSKIKDIILPQQFYSYTPVMCDSNGNELFRDVYYQKSQLNKKITGTSGLNLKDGDKLYINDGRRVKAASNLSLIENIGSSQQDLTAFGKQELNNASAAGDLIFLKYLLLTEIPYFSYTHSSYALWAAIRHNQLASVSLLLQYVQQIKHRLGCVREKEGEQGLPAITLAVQYGYFDMVKLLVFHGASLNPKKYDILRCINPEGVPHDKKWLIANYLFANGAHPGEFDFYREKSQQLYIKPFLKILLKSSVPNLFSKKLLNIIFDYMKLPIEFFIQVKQLYTSLLKPFANDTDLNKLNLYLPPATLKQHINIKIPNSVLKQALINSLDELDGTKFIASSLYKIPLLENFTLGPIQNHTIQDISENILNDYDIERYNKLLNNNLIIDSSLIEKALQKEVERYRSGIHDPFEQLLSTKFLNIQLGNTLRLQRQQCNANLHKAVLENKLGNVKKYLKQGASLNSNLYHAYPTAPIHIAVMSDYYEISQFLIRSGADLERANLSNQLPLQLAHSDNMVSLLIENGAFPLDSKHKNIHINKYVKPFLYTVLSETLLPYIPIVLVAMMFEYLFDNDSDFWQPTDTFKSVANFYEHGFKSLHKFKEIFTDFEQVKLQPKAMREFIYTKIATEFLPHIIETYDRDVFNMICNNIPRAVITEKLLRDAINIEQLRHGYYEHKPALCMTLIAIRFGGNLSRKKDERLINNLIQHAIMALTSLPTKFKKQHSLIDIVCFLNVIKENLMLLPVPCQSAHLDQLPSVKTLISFRARSGLFSPGPKLGAWKVTQNSSCQIVQNQNKLGSRF